MSVTFMSAVTIIAYPTESYAVGTIVLWYSVSGVIPMIFACVYYIPLIHRLHLSSIYEVTYVCHTCHISFHKDIFEESALFGKTMQLPLI